MSSQPGERNGENRGREEDSRIGGIDVLAEFSVLSAPEVGTGSS